MKKKQRRKYEAWALGDGRCFGSLKNNSGNKVIMILQKKGH